jgi:hypothetical protein
MCVLISLQFLPETFKNSARCHPKCTQVFVKSTRHSCQSLMKSDFSRHIFKKNTQIPNLAKIRSMRAEFSMRTKRWSDMTKLSLLLAILRMHLKSSALPIFPPEWSLSNLKGIHDSLVLFQMVKCNHYSHFSLRRKIANAGYIPIEN